MFIMERFSVFSASQKVKFLDIEQVDNKFEYSLLFDICCDGFTTCMWVCVELEELQMMS